MILFFDTSALIKRYISEIGSPKVDDLFDAAEEIIVSPITKIEAFSTIKRLLNTKVIPVEDYEKLKENLNDDFRYFKALSFTKEIQDSAIKLIESYQLKTLDSIQLASCLSRRTKIMGFVVSDIKLKRAADQEGIDVIDPTEFQ